MRRLLALVLAGVLLACVGETPGTGSGAPAKAEWFDEGGNVLSLLKGATVLDRSGEVSFEFASMLALDGHPTTAWSAPPLDLQQWLIAELPARSRIDAVGIDIGTYAVQPELPKGVRFETSLDGAQWTEAGTFDFEERHGSQVRQVEVGEARFVRVTTLTNHGSRVTINVPTLLVQGEELDKWTRPSVEGRWTLNDLVGEFHQNGARVYGRVDMDPPMLIDGTWCGRIVRFSWVRGRSYGIGLLSVNPEGSTLNGLWWYEQFVDAGNELGIPWFGSRVGEAEPFGVATPAIAQIHIERNGRFPLFGLIFKDDGELDVEASRAAIDFVRLALDSFPEYRVRLEVAEYHSSDANQNLAVSYRESTGLRDGLEAAGLPMDRIVIVPAGSARPYPYTSGPLHWAMYSRVDFSLTAE